MEAEIIWSILGKERNYWNDWESNQFLLFAVIRHSCLSASLEGK